MNVVDLSARRATAQADDGCATCPCGSGWFELRLPNSSQPGAVCLQQDGTVSGYAGQPHCIECGTVWLPR
jgi:hypothetical protein